MKEVWFYLRQCVRDDGLKEVDDDVFYYESFEKAEENRSRDKSAITPVMKGYVKAAVGC